MPAMIFSSVDLPEPLRPMIPRVSPFPSSRLTASRTRRSRNRRGRKSARAWARTVSRWASGIRNVLLTPRTSRTAIGLQVLGHPRRERAKHEDAGAEDHERLEGEERVGLG